MEQEWTGDHCRRHRSHRGQKSVLLTMDVKAKLHPGDDGVVRAIYLSETAMGEVKKSFELPIPVTITS